LHSDVKQLLEVQNIDQRVSRLNRAAEGIPRERSQRESKLEQLRLALATSEQSRLESERQSDSEIKNLEAKLGAIKNNAEYQAILFQIEAVKKERDISEEESLGLLDRSAAMGETLEKTKAEYAEEEKVFSDFCVEADKLIVSQRAEIEEVSKGRDEKLDGVPAELVEEYGRLFDTRDGQAICEAEAQFCI
jgi:predicted  nucleic acid-binding Zn-ribbon protein